MRHRVSIGLMVVSAILAIGVVTTPRAAPASQTVWDGIYTEEQANRGEPLYTEHCASCHGSDLTGGEMAPGLKGTQFVWTWNGLSVGELFERLRVTMPEGDPTTISREDKADVLAFLLLANNFPAGNMELASRTEILDQIMFEALPE